MAVNSFANIVNSYGLKSNGMQAIDVVSGVPVRIVNSNGVASVFVYAGGKDKAAMIAGPIISAAQSMGLAKPRVQGDSITFGFKKQMMAVDDYSKIREIITANAGAFSADQCPYCFMGGCDSVGMYKSATATKMHRACYMKNRNTEMEKVENNDGNYVTGILGAIGAAILAVIVLDLLALGADRIYFYLYIMFPVFIAGGFKLGKGPYGAKGTFCHILISFLAMFVYFYIQGCYLASIWYEITMAQAAPYFMDIVQILLLPEFIKNAGIELVCFFVGILIAVFANPTSKKNGRKLVQQNDIFLIPISTADYSGFETTTEQYQNAYDTSYNTVSNDYVDAYGNNSGNNNNGFGN